MPQTTQSAISRLKQGMLAVPYRTSRFLTPELRELASVLKDLTYAGQVKFTWTNCWTPFDGEAALIYYLDEYRNLTPEDVEAATKGKEVVWPSVIG